MPQPALKVKGKEERGIYYPILKFTPKELAFHRSCTLTFPTAKNVIEGLRQRNLVVFNQAFKIFDISCDVATGWHPEDWELASSQRAAALSGTRASHAGSPCVNTILHCEKRGFGIVIRAHRRHHLTSLWSFFLSYSSSHGQIVESERRASQVASDCFRLALCTHANVQKSICLNSPLILQ